MKYIAYVLKDLNGKFYKGVTNNLERRFREHQLGHTRTTQKMRNIQIVYTEEHGSFVDARKREKYLKSAAGRRFLKKVLSIT
jgi:putative endonuclease